MAESDEEPDVREPLNEVTQGRAKMVRQADGPKVGIFWELEGKLILDAVGLDDAEPYGRFKNYPLGHEELWNRYQRMNAVPCDKEYDQVPRGRVVWDGVDRHFLLYADLSILRNKALLRQILRELKLRSSTTTMRLDAHYRTSRRLSEDD